jgi:cytochrome c553
MNMKSRTAFALVTVTMVFLPIAALAQHQSEAASRVDFARQILPVLSEKCFVCHGPDGTDKDVLRLDSEAEATRDLGGYRAVDPDHPKQSELLARILSDDAPMPPEDAEKQLSDAERQLLARWIREGGKYATHWAFVPPKKNTPVVVAGRSPSEIVDAFIRDGFKERAIDFAPEADRATLARRAALVLTGLPPEPDLLAAFLNDNRPDAYARYVDQLLASPRFGEHRARYWLDAVRYGDTHGLHLDNRRGIYPYRNWVIYAFNQNLPLDEFIIWQLAGDLLPHPTLQQLVATGFVRMNPSTAEGGVIPDEFQAKNNFDRVETVGTVLLGMTLTCARCHSHKYDPIPQTEYYRLLAFFNNTSEEPLDGNKYDYAPVVKAPADVATWDRWNQLEAAQQELISNANTWVTNQSNPDEEVIRQWQQGDDSDRLAMLADPAGVFATTDLHSSAVELANQIAALKQEFATTLIAQELPQPRTTHVLHRGEYDQPAGEPLTPGVLSVMGGMPDDLPRNRLGLAQWLTSHEHPLVARVLVNRIWQQVFGTGLVRTPEDFGLQGEQPTHPELLDWLAVELQESQWNMKRMFRILVNSRTFRQQSAWREDVDDSQNRLFARGPRFRLDAEVIRDIGLWSSGLLDPTMGGEGVKPYQPEGLWSALMHPASNTKKYERDQGHRLYRRSLYVYWKRTCPHPMLTLFDAPSREVSCVRRSRTDTPLQSLGLLNETQRIEMGRALAQRLLLEAPSDDQRFDRLFTLLASRPATDVEREACRKLLARMRERYADANDDAVTLLSIGDAPRNETLDSAEHAAWTQLAVTVLASDVGILLY